MTSIYIIKPTWISPTTLNTIRHQFQNSGLECISEPTANNIAILPISGGNAIDPILEMLNELVTKNFRVIILYTGELNDFIKWKLLLTGARDVIDWEDHNLAISFIKSRINRWQKIDEIMNEDEVKNKMIGDSPCWKNFFSKVIEAAYFTNNNILLLGESGTGKELTASLIHYLDQRKDKSELVLLDCTTISPELSGSEFYGHEKGSFTSAISSRDGAFAIANKGTLFLDELGELPLQLQGGLLRAIQEKTYKRVGSNIWRQSDFRLICATNRDLKKEVSEGRFRADLYYRIASAVYLLPNLDNRREDIPELVRYFLRKELNIPVAPEVEQTMMNYLISRNYPGNIRELKQLIGRIAMRYTGTGQITIGDLPEDELPEIEQMKEKLRNENSNLHQSLRLAIASGKDLARIKNDIAKIAMEIALETSGGNLKLAARKLNVEVRTLQYIRKRGDDTIV